MKLKILLITVVMLIASVSLVGCDAKGIARNLLSDDSESENNDESDVKQFTKEFYFIECDGGYQLNKYNGIETEEEKNYVEVVEIPSEYKGKPVVEIGDYAFYCMSVKNIKMPNTIVKIGESAFEGCDYLETINFSTSLKTIGDNAFSECYNIKIKAKDIPKTIEKIGFNVFAPTKNSVYDILKNNENYVTTDDAIFSKDMKTLITYNLTSKNEKYIVPDGVEEIAPLAFYFDNKLKTIVLPEGLKTIGEGAFSRMTLLENINFPKSIENIGINVFEDTEWLKNKKEEFVTINGKFLIKYNGKSSYTLTIPDGITHILCSFNRDIVALENSEEYIPYRTIENLNQNTKYIKYLSLPGSLQYISPIVDLGSVINYTFRSENKYFAQDKYSSLYSKDMKTLIRCANNNDGIVHVPDTVEVIGESAFYNDQNVKTVYLPDGLKEIKDNAFKYCFNLKSISIPSKVTSIGSEAFNNCVSLRELSIPSTVTKINSKTFAFCKYLEIEIPSEVNDISTSAFELSNECKVICKKGSFAEDYAKMLFLNIELR